VDVVYPIWGTFRLPRPTRTEGSASIIAGSLGISGPVVVFPLQSDNSISLQRWIVVAHSTICKHSLAHFVGRGGNHYNVSQLDSST
jgi:hypothetical protein